MENNIFYNHYNKKKYLNTFKKVLTFYLPAQELKTATNLNQNLVKVGLNYNEFCEKFNNLTLNFPVGVIVPVSVFYTPKEKNFELCLRPFQLKHILQQYMRLDDEPPKRYQITLSNLYKTLLIKSFVLNEKNIQILLRSIFGTLRSYQYPVEILYSLDDIKKIAEIKNIGKNPGDFLDFENIKSIDIDTVEKTVKETLREPEEDTVENTLEEKEQPEKEEETEEPLFDELTLLEILVAYEKNERIKKEEERKKDEQK